MMELIYGPFISREQAKAQGLKRYFIGKLCRRGHSSPRFTSSGNCIECIAVLRANESQEQTDRRLKCQRASCKRWRLQNPKKRLQGQRDYDRRNMHKKAIYIRNRRANDPSIKLLNTLRTRLRDAFKYCQGKPAKSIRALVGCDFDSLSKYLESQFLPGMSWENHGLHGWHIDHIRPCASFDLTDPAQQRECFHYTNLQPLWAADNIAKSDTWEAA